MKEIFKIIISDFLEAEIPTLIEREVEVPLNSKKIISLVGARRTGKTFLFYSLIKKLRKTIHVSQIIYINFEDDRLFPLQLKDLNSFVEAYFEMFPDNRDKTVYFFFDEIQNVDNWEKFVRRISDTVNCRIFITGSSSKFLSKEIATSLRGRTISFEVFPFSFSEYLQIKGIKKDYFSSKNRAKIVNAFEQFFLNSSLPEMINASEIEKPGILRDYLDLIIYKDLIERYQITNLHLIKYLIRFLLSNSANLISISKIYNDLKSQSVKVSKNSIYQYIEYLTDAYILFPSKLFSNNIREIQRNPQKIYSLDNGLVDVVSITKDIGRKFENTLYLELRRKYKDISYIKLKQEVDFCFMHNGRLHLINAVYSVNEVKTKKREINSLLEAMKHFNISESILLTNSIEEKINVESKIINIVPLWKWLIRE